MRSGENPELTTREKHTRECFVVAEEGADLARIENEIKTMPNYFSDYDTTVHFIDEAEMKKNHSGLPHGGSVIYSGESSDGVKHVIEYSLTLDSNPEFTGSVLAAFARAIVRLNNEGVTGAKTVNTWLLLRDRFGKDIFLRKRGKGVFPDQLRGNAKVSEIVCVNVRAGKMSGRGPQQLLFQQRFDASSPFEASVILHIISLLPPLTVQDQGHHRR